jgi:predicted site-specific integrase-resolvase
MLASVLLFWPPNVNPLAGRVHWLLARGTKSPPHLPCPPLGRLTFNVGRCTTHRSMNATKNPTIVYLRVSTAEQENDSQVHQVLEYCRVRGWQPPVVFRDAVSGASSSRPGLEQTLAQVRAGGVH